VHKPDLRTRFLTIVAQDPAIRSGNGKILTAEVSVPAEELAPGPRGYRVHVVDFDTSVHTFYKPRKYQSTRNGRYQDPYKNPSNGTILEDPRFHAQNAYAIIMRTLARFEFALGRRISWSFSGHQLKVSPHAFADANAFYSKQHEALVFGYFQGKKGTIFSSLSHDVIAHETTHALLDGLRERYIDPSSPDQGGFHEGFADIVALLSVFSIREVVTTLLDWGIQRRRDRSRPKSGHQGLINKKDVTLKALRKSALLGMAEEMGKELGQVRGRGALRQSVSLSPSLTYYMKEEEFTEPHRRGEILVAAMLNAFLEVWCKRLEQLRSVKVARHKGEEFLDRQRVADEGSEVADYLLTMAVRAIDYTPPVHLEFGDYLSALLTADHEIRPNDSKYGFREHLKASFAAYGIVPASPGEAGQWEPPDHKLSYERTHYENMSRDPDEVFRFAWENRKALRLYEDSYSRILSVRPCIRIGPDDGFPLRETVAECLQQVEVRASELAALRIPKPARMPGNAWVRLQGGLTLIFNEYGHLKFSIRNRIDDPKRQGKRLRYLWDSGYFTDRQFAQSQGFHAMHRLRALGTSMRTQEEW